jgi:hypothetical protein
MSPEHNLTYNMLFSDYTRTYTERKKTRMSSYAFLDQSAWPVCELIRTHYTDWAKEFVHDSEWLNRFRSSDLKQHTGAETELILSTILQKQGFSLEKHPDLGSSKRPDFKVSKDFPFIIECTLAGDSFDSKSDKLRKETIEEIIDDIEYHPCFINVSFQKLSPRSISKTKMLAFIEEKSKLHADLPNEELIHINHCFENNDWELELSFIRKDPDKIRKRSLGFISNQAKTIHTAKPLITSLNDKKPGRYGKMDLPYVICVNTSDQFAREECFSEALFGQYGSTYIEVDPIYPEGFFLNKHKNNTGVSTVLFFRNLGGYMLDKSQGTLWHNPYARNPLPRGTLPFDEIFFTPEGDRLIRTEDRKDAHLTTLTGIDHEEYINLKDEKTDRIKE